MGDTLRDLAVLFLRLGAIGFGGPAAHLSMMEEEVVNRRRWLSRAQFLDLLGVTNLIPGPNSTEMAMQVGYAQASWPGLLVAGLAFILPAVVITAAFAAAYVSAGVRPDFGSVTAGIRAALPVLIAVASARLGKAALGSRSLAVVAVVVFLLSLVGVNEVLLLFGGTLVGTTLLVARGGGKPLALLVPALVGLPSLSPETTLSARSLFWFFLRIGAVLYGGGYVLVAFLHGGLVERLGWLSNEQLLDAIAAGQFTPGPVLSTATFVGYVLKGPMGAAAATAGIFLPSFLLVGLTAPLVPRIRRSPVTTAALDSVNASAVALMAAVAVTLARTSVTGWETALIAVLAALALWRWRPNPAWLVVGGGIMGWGLLR